MVIENARLYQAVHAERAAQELRIASEIQRALLLPNTFLPPVVDLAAARRRAAKLAATLRLRAARRQLVVHRG